MAPRTRPLAVEFAAPLHTPPLLNPFPWWVAQRGNEAAAERRSLVERTPWGMGGGGGFERGMDWDGRTEAGWKRRTECLFFEGIFSLSVGGDVDVRRRREPKRKAGGARRRGVVL